VKQYFLPLQRATRRRRDRSRRDSPRAAATPLIVAAIAAGANGATIAPRARAPAAENAAEQTRDSATASFDARARKGVIDGGAIERRTIVERL